MASVPYSPVLEVAPGQTATPRIGIATPEAAFGGATAKAIEGLGAVTEHAGNELFGRAVALQNLNNETEAKQADADYMIAAGEVHAKYQSLEGKDRVDAYPGYVKQLEDLRVKTRDKLSNPMAQRMYDSSSLGTMGRSIFNGAGAAATANKQWQVGTLQGAMDVDVKQASDSPFDETFIQQKIAKAKEDATQLAGFNGFEPNNPKTVATINKAVSNIRTGQIIGMSKTQPFEASKFLEAHKTELSQDDYNKLYDRIETKKLAVGASNIASTVYDPAKTLTQLEADARAKAKEIDPQDQLLPDHAVASVRSKYFVDHQAKTQEQLGAKQTIEDLIQKHNVQDVQELLAIPGADEVVQRLSPTQRRGLQTSINTYQASIDKATNKASYRQYLGMYNDDNGKFMDTNFMGIEGLSKSDRNYFMGLQRTARAEGDPRVARAMKQLSGFAPGTLDELNVTGPTKDRDTANQFIGTLHDAIQSYQESNGKPPDEKAITTEIFPLVTRQMNQTHWWRTDTKAPFFSVPVPDTYKKEYLKSVPTAKDEEIHRDYNRQMFDHFFAGQPSRGKNQGRVGQ
jgi:hypothetical protein